MLREFVADLQPRVLGHLVEVVFDKMTLAGEAGSLLKIEEELRDSIVAAKRQWVSEHERAVDRKGRPMLFTQAEMERVKTGSHQPQLFDLYEATDEQFWNDAESRVLDALRDYASHAANGGRLRRQLFAEDAEHGFAFVDVCQKRFDVLLMNPPFGDLSISTKEFIDNAYPLCRSDYYPVFVTRATTWFADGGLLGTITNRTGFFLSGLSDWRARLLGRPTPLRLVADLGHGVLDDALVETAAYVLSRSKKVL